MCQRPIRRSVTTALVPHLHMLYCTDIPDMTTAQREIARALRPNGRFREMLYARWLLNYLVSIIVLRRPAIGVLYLIGARLGGISRDHLAEAR